MGKPTIPRAQLMTSIERVRDKMIDLDIAVDDARVDVDRAVEQFQNLVRVRDETARHLQALIETAV